MATTSGFAARSQAKDDIFDTGTDESSCLISSKKRSSSGAAPKKSSPSRS